MKKVLTWLLLLIVLCGCLCGCTTTNQSGEVPAPQPASAPVIINNDNPLDFQILQELDQKFSNIRLIQEDPGFIQVIINLTEEEQAKLTNEDVVFEEYFPTLLNQNIVDQAKAENVNIVIIIKYFDSNFAITYNAITQEFFDFEMETEAVG